MWRMEVGGGFERRGSGLQLGYCTLYHFIGMSTRSLYLKGDVNKIHSIISLNLIIYSFIASRLSVASKARVVDLLDDN